jgi:hypothetical protein
LGKVASCVPSNAQADDYEFLVPYFAQVSTRISAGVTLGTSQKATDDSGVSKTKKKPKTKDKSKGGSGGSPDAGANPAPSGAPSGSPTLTLTVVPEPQGRAYLYYRKNAFYSDSVNVTISADGMLSGSDSSSTQQISAILTEVAQTAAAVGKADLFADFLIQPPPPAVEERTNPSECVAALKSASPLYGDFDPGSTTEYDFPTITAQIKDTTGKVTGSDQLTFSIKLTKPSRLNLSAVQISDNTSLEGIVAFDPVPYKAGMFCAAAGKLPVQIGPTQVVNLYLDSFVVQPNRDFFTQPQDTFTFNEGFITGHKYVDQSGAKGFFDTITAPVKALLPSGGGSSAQPTSGTTSGSPPS